MTAAILIPCRNGARHLSRLLTSVANQTRPFDAIWLYDDASSDGSGPLAESLGARVLRGETPVGASAARNRLLRATDAAWVHFHDADDSLSPDFLAATLNRADSQSDLVLCDVDWIDEATGQKCSEWRYRESDYREEPIVSLIHNTVGGISGLYRRELLLRIGGFDEHRTYWEDTDLHVRLIKGGARFAVVNQVLSFAYRRSDSLSNSNLRAVWRSKTELLAQLANDGGPSVRRAAAEDAERVARHQLRLRDIAGMRRSLAVCRQAGMVPPTSHQAGLRWVARNLNSTSAFVLQETIRLAAERLHRSAG